MSSFFPSDEVPTIARNPSRSLWEAALVGHVEPLGQVLTRTAPAVYAWMRASGADPVLSGIRTGDFLGRIQISERPNPQEEDVERLQEFLQRRLEAYVAAGYPESPESRIAIDLVFDQAQAERRYLREAGRRPVDVFSRRWALGALELTIETLTEEWVNEGKSAQVPFLRQSLSFSGGEEVYAQMSERTGVSVSALRVAVFRFRQRYREILRRLVGDTVRNADEVDSELTKLLVSAS